MIAGNITVTISDHLPQFLFAPNVLSKTYVKNPIFIKDNGQDLFKVTLCLIILITIGLMFST